MGVGAHEAVLLQALGRVLLDRPGGLVEAVGPVGGRTNAVALVVDRRHGRPVGLAVLSCRNQRGPHCLEFREHPSPQTRRFARQPPILARRGARGTLSVEIVSPPPALLPHALADRYRVWRRGADGSGATRSLRQSPA